MSEAALLPPTRRKVYAIYFSFREFGNRLRFEAAWIPFGYLRTSILKEVPGGMSRAMRSVFRSLHALESPGIVVKRPSSGEPLLVVARVWRLMGDEAALKVVWCCKGASGTQCCFSCKNVVNYAARQASEGDYLCSVGEEDAAKFDVRSDGDVWEAVDLLAARQRDMTADGFKLLEQSLGFRHEPEGLLADHGLRNVVRPSSANTYDAMHVTIANGTMNWEFYLVLEACRAQLGLRYHAVAAHAAKWTMPANVDHRVTRDRFSKEVEKATRKACAFKASASDMVALYPILRNYLLMELSADQRRAIKNELQSFLRLCTFVDIYWHAKNGVTGLHEEASRAVTSHRRAHNRAYGEESAKPKHHLQMHIPSQMQGWSEGLVDCFCHERKHQLGKRCASDVKNTGAYERSILIRAMLQQCGELRAMSLDECFLRTKIVPVSDELRISAEVVVCGCCFAARDVAVSRSAPRRAYMVLAGAQAEGAIGAIAEELACIEAGQWSGSWKKSEAADMEFIDLRGFLNCPFRAEDDRLIVLTLTPVSKTMHAQRLAPVFALVFEPARPQHGNQLKLLRSWACMVSCLAAGAHQKAAAQLLNTQMKPHAFGTRGSA